MATSTLLAIATQALLLEDDLGAAAVPGKSGSAETKASGAGVSGCLSRARTASCLVPPRVESERMFPGFAGRFARLLARANLVFVVILLCGI